MFSISAVSGHEFHIIFRYEQHTFFKISDTLFIKLANLVCFWNLHTDLFRLDAHWKYFLPLSTRLRREFYLAPEWLWTDEDPLKGIWAFHLALRGSGWIAEAIKCCWWSLIRLHRIRCFPLCPFWKLCTLSLSGADSDIINVHFSKLRFWNMPEEVFTSVVVALWTEISPCGTSAANVRLYSQTASDDTDLFLLCPSVFPLSVISQKMWEKRKKSEAQQRL